MPDGEPAGDGLRIAQVEKLTGVGVHTLRAWERRYGVPRPARSEGRQRLYSPEDVDLIRRMQALADSGIALHRAAGIALHGLETRPGPGGGNPAALLERLLDALLRYDERRAAILWNEVLESGDLLTAFERVVVPVLGRLAEACRDGLAGAGQERFATAFVRARLDGLARQATPLPGAAVALLACLAEERDELPLQMLNALLRFQGIATIYLGPDVPEEGLLRAVREVGPRLLCLQAGSTTAVARLPALVSALTRLAPRTAVLFGGKAPDDEPALRSLAGAVYGGPTLRDALDVAVRLTRRPAMGVRS